MQKGFSVSINIVFKLNMKHALHFTTHMGRKIMGKMLDIIHDNIYSVKKVCTLHLFYL